MKKITLLLLVLLAVVVSCKDDEDPAPVDPVSDQLKMALIPTFGTEDLMLDQTYITDEGYRVQFTDIKCYITEVKNGSKTLCSGALFDFRESGTTLFTKPGEPSDYSQVNALLGVGSDRNHDDPTAFSSYDPLYITNANDMHWGWNPGYLFIKVEAKVDTIDNAIDNFDHYVVFHIGGDDYDQPLSFTSLNWAAIGNSTYQEVLKLDMKTFLNNGSSSIDLKTEYSSHTSAGQEALSLKVIEHFRDAISLY